MTQAVIRSPLTAEVPSSSLGHSMWVSWLTKRSLGRIFSGFPVFLRQKYISTISPHSFITFYYNFPWDGASGMVSRHPSQSQNLNKELISCQKTFQIKFCLINDITYEREVYL